MARARNIKPGFFANEVLAECQYAARLLFAGLWTLADREGRLEDRPKKIKAEIFPYENIDVDKLLSELAEKKEQDGSPAFIMRYEIGCRAYIQVMNFVKHQNPHHKEVASVIPAAPGYNYISGNKDAAAACGREDQSDLGPMSAEARGNKTAACPTDSLNPITDPPSPHPENLSPERTDDEEDVFKVYGREIGVVSSLTKVLLEEAVSTYSSSWVIEAIKESVRHNARNFSYIEAILKGWKKDGFKAKKPKNRSEDLAEEAADLWYKEVLPGASPYAKWSGDAVIAGVRACGGGLRIAEARNPDTLRTQFIRAYTKFKEAGAGKSDGDAGNI